MTDVRSDRMSFGAFMAPYHALNENVTLTIHRDMQLVELMDALDFDEVWVGEHHSAGFEPIASPELFIAAVAERTKRIRLGTGVNSLTYHHPLILADRMVQLDHQTRGRIMFGVGPGQLPSDAAMMGIDPRNQRAMMVAALEAIQSLLAGERVTRDEGWFRLENAMLQILPYQRPCMEMAVACAVTPNGPTTAGRLGASMLSVAASSDAGFSSLPEHWSLYEAAAHKHGHRVNRDNWRVVAPIHVAETRDQALADVAKGIIPNVLGYLRALGVDMECLRGIDTGEDAAKSWMTNTWGTFGRLACGTPDDVATYIEEMARQAGGFGTFLLLAHNSADWDATRKSHEMFARYVMPRFRGGDRRSASLDWIANNREAIFAPLFETRPPSLPHPRAKAG